MVTNRKQHNAKTCSKQASADAPLNPNKIGASTPYDFSAKNLTPFGGLPPIATMLKKVGFKKEPSCIVKRWQKVRFLS